MERGRCTTRGRCQSSNVTALALTLVKERLRVGLDTMSSAVKCANVRSGMISQVENRGFQTIVSIESNVLDSSEGRSDSCSKNECKSTVSETLGPNILSSDDFMVASDVESSKIDLGMLSGNTELILQRGRLLTAYNTSNTFVVEMVN